MPTFYFGNKHGDVIVRSSSTSTIWNVHTRQHGKILENGRNNRGTRSSTLAPPYVLRQEVWGKMQIRTTLKKTIHHTSGHLHHLELAYLGSLL